VTPALELLEWTGWAAAILLALALAATPVGKALALARGEAPGVVAWRRRLGISAACAALAHGVIAIAAYLGDDAWSSIAEVPWLRSGALAAALLAPLLATSFPALVRAARIRLWKPLHRLAYAAGALAIHHVLLGPFAPRALAIGLLALALVLALGRLSRRRDREAAGDGTMSEP
jgi:sulfoxide reductase heme-binding subunit YedZ